MRRNLPDTVTFDRKISHNRSMLQASSIQGTLLATRKGPSDDADVNFRVLPPGVQEIYQAPQEMLWCSFLTSLRKCTHTISSIEESSRTETFRLY